MEISNVFKNLTSKKPNLQIHLNKIKEFLDDSLIDNNFLKEYGIIFNFNAQKFIISKNKNLIANLSLKKKEQQFILNQPTKLIYKEELIKYTYDWKKTQKDLLNLLNENGIEPIILYNDMYLFDIHKMFNYISETFKFDKKWYKNLEGCYVWFLKEPLQNIPFRQNLKVVGSNNNFNSFEIPVINFHNGSFVANPKPNLIKQIKTFWNQQLVDKENQLNKVNDNLSICNLFLKDKVIENLKKIANSLDKIEQERLSEIEKNVALLNTTKKNHFGILHNLLTQQIDDEVDEIYNEKKIDAIQSVFVNLSKNAVKRIALNQSKTDENIIDKFNVYIQQFIQETKGNNDNQVLNNIAMSLNSEVVNQIETLRNLSFKLSKEVETLKQDYKLNYIKNKNELEQLFNQSFDYIEQEKEYKNYAFLNKTHFHFFFVFDRDYSKNTTGINNSEFKNTKQKTKLPYQILHQTFIEDETNQTFTPDLLLAHASLILFNKNEFADLYKVNNPPAKEDEKKKQPIQEFGAIMGKYNKNARQSTGANQFDPNLSKADFYIKVFNSYIPSNDCIIFNNKGETNSKNDKSMEKLVLRLKTMLNEFVDEKKMERMQKSLNSNGMSSVFRGDNEDENRRNEDIVDAKYYDYIQSKVNVAHSILKTRTNHVVFFLNNHDLGMEFLEKYFENNPKYFKMINLSFNKVLKDKKFSLVDIANLVTNGNTDTLKESIQEFFGYWLNLTNSSKKESLISKKTGKSLENLSEIYIQNQKQMSRSKKVNFKTNDDVMKLTITLFPKILTELINQGYDLETLFSSNNID